MTSSALSYASRSGLASTRARRRRVGARTRVLVGAASVAFVILLWQTASVAGWLPSTVVPSADAVFIALGSELASGTFWGEVGLTMSSSMLGLLIVLVIATPLSLAIGRSEFVRESLWIPLEFLKPIPPVALIPLTLLLWGPSPTMKLFLVVFGSLWPLLTQMIYGVREVSGVALSMARSYRLGWWLTTSRIVIPSLLPFTATGLRVSAAIALIISVVTEMVAGAPGIGQAITLAQTGGQLPSMYALIVAAGLLGLAVNAAFRVIDRFLLFWHASQRTAA